VPPGWHTVPLGEARLARPGRDATVVTWGVGWSGPWRRPECWRPKTAARSR
jgi:Pyruvate/2-oxoglutarate dehydrogenase complex, dehydrogenase (E1) component, eukaryotic type, beta subunit